MKFNKLIKLNLVFLFLLMILFLLPNFSLSVNINNSTGYLADINISVSRIGETNITGFTNFNSLSNVKNSNLFTFKKRDYWLFNLSTKKKFDAFIFDLALPKNIYINYIKTVKNFKITQKNGRFHIIGYGKDEPLTILVQYSFISKNNENQNNSINYNNTNVEEQKHHLYIYVISILFILLILISVFLYNVIKLKKKLEKSDLAKEKKVIKKNRTKKRDVKKNKIKNLEYFIKENYTYDFEIFSERQKEILKLVYEKKTISQKELLDKLGIPKSSLSRNLRTLEFKNIIKTERVGLVKYVSFKSQSP